MLAATLYQGNPVGIKSFGTSINKDVCTQYAGAAGMLLQIISKSENLIFIKHSILGYEQEVMGPSWNWCKLCGNINDNFSFDDFMNYSA